MFNHKRLGQQAPAITCHNEPSSPPDTSSRSLPYGHQHFPSVVNYLIRSDLRPDSPRTSSSLDNHRSSPAESSNAQQWFDNSNNNARESNMFRVDRGAPFHIQPLMQPEFQQNSMPPANLMHPVMLPFCGGLPHTVSPKDNVDEYRSVIDDLTIRNKILKRRLQQYDQHRTMDQEKLLEIKMRGLSSSKKRELEEVLKSFVRNLHEPSAQDAPSLSTEPTNLQGLSTMAKPSSSHTSTKFADSGYGSLATSSQDISQRGSNKNTGAQLPLSGVEASKARDRNIQSYLHDIPEGLLPRQAPAVMTEDSKKKLVIARLEQLFQGRGASTDGHQQPLQQQEVSQSAARADRTEIEARGQFVAVEGKREACIMSSDVDESSEPLVPRYSNSISTSRSGQTTHQHEEKAGEQPKTEQRPTRPLDVDPHRASDPRENVEYLRHLGFPVIKSDSDKTANKENGWLYLNLIVNMAQLHTLSVTTDLVKDAISDYSSRFELSTDGRKIRWRNEPLPKLVKTNSVGEVSNVSSQRSSNGLGRKRIRSVCLGASTPMESSDAPASKRLAVVDGNRRSRNLPHHPLQPENSELVDSEMYDDQSMPPFPGVEDPASHESSAWNISGNITSGLGISQPQEEGAFVFYQTQKYFTDVSGDHSWPTKSVSRDYVVKSMRPLGLPLRGSTQSTSSEEEDSSAASIHGAISGTSLDVNADVYSNNGRLNIHETPIDCCEPLVNKSRPYTFEASGLGCINPTDNFTINATRQLERSVDAPPSKRRKISCLQNINLPSATGPTMVDRVISTKLESLLPSSLPPAMFAVSEAGTDSIEDEDEDDHQSTSYDYAKYSGISSSTSSSSEEDVGDEDATGLAHSMSVGSDEHESVDEFPSAYFDDEAESDDSEDDIRGRQVAMDSTQLDGRQLKERSPSMDLLATARTIDPQAIRKREREYDAEMAERLAEEMPAGSSAATYGEQGGSGFNSPRRHAVAMEVNTGDDDVKVVKDDAASASG